MTEIVKEYAEAIFALGCEEGKEEQFALELSEISEIFSDNAELYELLVCPGVSAKERCDIIDASFSESFHPHIVALLGLLCKKGHIKDFSGCTEEYMRLLTVRRGVVFATVTSAVELSEEEISSLRAKLETKCGKKVEIKTELDASLLGGVIVEIDGKIIDGSLREKLRQVKEVIGK